MIFATLLKKFATFRNRLATIHEDIKISEIFSDIPEKDNDELSFHKLVAWSYVFQYEISKNHINFFKNLSKINIPKHIHALRTCGSHNVTLDSERNINMRKEAYCSHASTWPPARINTWPVEKVKNILGAL